MRLFRRLLSFLVIYFALFLSSLFALETNTHEEINEYAATNALNNFSLDSYLLNKLAFKNGTDEKIEGPWFWFITTKKTVWQWIKIGGKKEDKPYWYMPYLRSVNHFHNPITDLGFSGIWGSGSLDGESSILWSQEPVGAQSPGGYYSWHDARYYFYNALIATDKTERNTNYAELFRGVGQLMHLVEDLSVPEHVRDDGHYIPGYEDWVEGTDDQGVKNVKILPGSGAIQILGNNVTPVFFEQTAIGDPNPLASVPVANLFDTNQYDGSNPDITKETDIGLSEYTNANFLSPDTIFSNDFSYPDWTNIVEYEKTVGTKKWTYLRKLGTGETDGSQVGYGEHIEHLARAKCFYKYLPAYFKSLGLKMDDAVYQNYAEKLIPYAVGYSAGLLSYFFRGEIDLVESDARYKTENLSDEDMEGTINSFQLFYDDFSDNRNEIQLTFYDASDNLISDPSAILTIPAQRSSTFEIEFQPPANPKNYILVFRGRLGNEDDAVIGKVIDKRIYFVLLPVDPVTRATSSKEYYYGNADVMETITEDELLFELVDDGGYWNTATSDWSSNPDTESLKVPLSVGGPQYIAKHWDEANNRVRFIPNLSYEKNAYQAFHKTYVDGESQQTLADFHCLKFQGNPIMMFGAYQENPGYMEYTDTGLYSVRPVPASDPGQRYFSEYHSTNFIDTFFEYDTAKFYYFDGSPTNEQIIPQDPDAPLTSVTAVSSAGNSFYISVPKIYDYDMPNPFWPSATISDGCSGVDVYLANLGLSHDSTENKCATADNNCGFVHEEPGASSNEAEFEIPYNYNSWVHVINGNPYYEELYINGQLVETSPPADRLETHYEILAVYKNIAVVRETTLVSSVETPIGYRYQNVVTKEEPYTMISPDVLDMVYSFVSTYYIYINGNRYNLSGQTFVESRILSFHNDNIDDDTQDPTQPIAWFLTGEHVDDITGYHIDRIFISDTFDGNYVLVAFDEYAYNNGAGLVHDLEEVDTGLDTQGGENKYFVYHDIPPEEIQGASHEALPSGRKLLLLKSDGTLEQSLQDPVGLGWIIGSIGILN